MDSYFQHGASMLIYEIFFIEPLFHLELARPKPKIPLNYRLKIYCRVYSIVKNGLISGMKHISLVDIINIM